MRRLRDPRAVVHALDAAVGDIVPVHERGHTGTKVPPPMFLPTPNEIGERSEWGGPAGRFVLHVGNSRGNGRTSVILAHVM